MILSNALLVLGLSGPDLVLVSGRQAGRVGSRFGAAIEGQLASWEAQPLHPWIPSDNRSGPPSSTSLSATARHKLKDDKKSPAATR